MRRIDSRSIRPTSPILSPVPSFRNLAGLRALRKMLLAGPHTVSARCVVDLAADRLS